VSVTVTRPAGRCARVKHGAGRPPTAPDLPLGPSFPEPAMGHSPGGHATGTPASPQRCARRCCATSPCTSSQRSARCAPVGSQMR
jgi:hypothetical protein